MLRKCYRYFWKSQFTYDFNIKYNLALGDTLRLRCINHYSITKICREGITFIQILQLTNIKHNPIILTNYSSFFLIILNFWRLHHQPKGYASNVSSTSKDRASTVIHIIPRMFGIKTKCMGQVKEVALGLLLSISPKNWFLLILDIIKF